MAYIEFKCPQPPARGGCANLHVLEVGSARPVEILAGADRLSSPRWTHDGLALVVAGALAGGGVGAVVRSGLFTIPRLGGIPRRLADDPVAFDTHASADSVAFLVEGDSGSTLRVMNVASGTAGTSHRIDVRPLDVAWSPDGRMFAISSYDQIYVFSRDGLQLSRTTRTVTRDNLRWSVDGRHILSFQWTAAQGDDFVAFPVNADGRLERPRLLASQEQTLLRGQFDVARRTGRVVIGSGSEFHDIWSFDLAAAPVKARRLTQGTNWYGPPALTSDGRSLYYLRADPLGNNIYRMVDGVETPLTAERQVVNNSLRLAHDDSVVTFESRFDSVHALVVYDIASGTARRVSRGPEEFGWVIPGHRDIVWFAPFEPALFITDSAGGNRRNADVTALGDQQRVFTRFFEWGNWFLAPDGESVAIVGGNRDVATVYRVSVRGGAATELVSFPRSEGVTGLAGWGRDGMIHVARGDPSSGGTALLRIDAASGAFRGSVVLPAPCNPAGVTVATQGRRAACEVIERRADLMILDGIRP